MYLKKYEYGKKRLALDISEVLYISVLGEKFIEMSFSNGDVKSIQFENSSNRDQFYNDILRDIEEINKPIVCTSIKAEQDAQRSEIIKNLIADGPCQIYPKEYEYAIGVDLTTDECINRTFESYTNYMANRLRDSVMTKPTVSNEEVPPLKCNGCPVDDITDF